MTDEEMDRIENRLDFAERDGWDLLAALREERAARLKAEAERDALQKQADEVPHLIRRERDEALDRICIVECERNALGRERDDLRARLSRAREALAGIGRTRHSEFCRLFSEMETGPCDCPFGALRAALAEPLGAEDESVPADRPGWAP